MGKKALTKKKKGPKGKKARAKAKLDRQWGETVDEDDVQQPRIRRGKSRLGVTRTKSRDNVVSHQDFENIGEQHQLTSLPSDVDESSDSDPEVDGFAEGNALGQLLRSINKSSKKSKIETRNEDNNLAESIRSDESDQQSIKSMDQDESSSSDDDSDEESEDETEDNIDVDSDENAADDMPESKHTMNDPFASHFNKPVISDDSRLSTALSVSQDTRRVPTRHLNPNLEFQLSGSVTDELSSSGLLLGSERNISVSSVEQKWHEMSDSSFQFTRKVLKQEWKKFNKSARRRNADSEQDADGTNSKRLQFSALQNTLYPSLASYADVLVTAESRQNREALDNLFVLHILNHVITSRSRVQRHNRKLKDLMEKAETHVDSDDDKFRDQGYTRPKVLVLLPTRGMCLTLVQRMVTLLGDSALVDNMDRFEAEYGAPVVEEEDADEKALKRRKAVLEAKGPAWQELFGDDVNDDDDFKIGIAVTPKAAGKKAGGAQSRGGVSLKLYSEFYRSDIIVASPLGLKMSVTSEDGEEDVDFLSSIEVCLVTHANVLLMQNWDHIKESLSLINRQPKKNNDTDFSRVRNYFLNGHAAYWRQVIICSNFSDPYILSTFKRHAKNIGGRLVLRRTVPSDEASLCDVLMKVKQVFQRVPCNSFAAQGDDKLQYFEDRVLPQIFNLKQKHTLIFIPSYFDFVSIRNILLRKEAEFVSISEYARDSEVSRGRARFLQGRKPIMLYTGRCHFFSRHIIKGARHVVFFGLPEHAEFYSDIVNVLNEGLGGANDVDSTLDMMDAPASCLSMFTKYDAHALERIVGSQHCERMLSSEKSTFMFCT